jgi:hypothetical protein
MRSFVDEVVHRVDVSDLGGALGDGSCHDFVAGARRALEKFPQLGRVGDLGDSVACIAAADGEGGRVSGDALDAEDPGGVVAVARGCFSCQGGDLARDGLEDAEVDLREELVSVLAGAAGVVADGLVVGGY